MGSKDKKKDKNKDKKKKEKKEKGKKVKGEKAKGKKENRPTSIEKTYSGGISIGGDAVGNAAFIGDENVVNIETQYTKTSLPDPDTVDMRAELDALRVALGQLESEEQRKIENALMDVEDELAKPEPDKDEVGQAVERALGYASKSSDFDKVLDQLKPVVTNAASWLGDNWHKILGAAGLCL